MEQSAEKLTVRDAIDEAVKTSYAFNEAMSMVVKALNEAQVDPSHINPIAEIGALVSHHVKEQRTTQKELALLADLSSKTVSNLISTPQTARVSSIQALLDVMGMELFIGPKRG